VRNVREEPEVTTETRVQDRTVKLGGLNFHYRDWEHDGAQVLLLLHGFSSHARSWDTFALAMQDGYRVLALDQRGHGETDWATDYAPERMVEDINAFVGALALKQFALLGLSMGGRVAYHYTALYPVEVERLVIVDIGPEIVPMGSERIRMATQASDVFDDPERAIRASRMGNPRASEAELRHRVLNNLKQRPDGRWTWRWDAALRSPDRPLSRPDTEAGWAALRQITCPTLIVRGADSDILSREIANRMLRAIQDVRLVEVPNSGHSVPLDNPAGFLSSVRAFL
jgi:pimeloyl-ACP methyl ester carboxylesterase